MSTDERGHEYEVARDRTGEVLKMIQRRESDQAIRRDIDMFKKPMRLECNMCGKASNFRVLIDAEGDEGLTMLGCGNCGCWWRAFQMKVPQMNDQRARALGIALPGQAGFDFEIEL